LPSESSSCRSSPPIPRVSRYGAPPSSNSAARRYRRRSARITSARETLADYGDHRFRLLYRDADGVPEQHDTIVDVSSYRAAKGRCFSAAG
jgi:hypothetical protein